MPPKRMSEEERVAHEIEAKRRRAEAQRTRRQNMNEQQRTAERERANQAQRRRRNNLADDQRAMEHEREIQQQRERRQNMNEEQHEREIQQQRERRQNMNEEQLEAQRQQDNQRYHERRQNMNEEQLEDQRQQDNQRHHERRQNMNEEQLEDQRQQDNQRHHERRQNMNEQQLEDQRQQENQRHHERRQNMNEEELQVTRDQHNQARRARINTRGNQTLRLARSNISENDILQHYCGELEKECPNCKAKYFKDEATTKKVYTTCCRSGAVKLPSIRYPQVFQDLLEGKHPHSRNFMQHIRSFNSSIAFASVGANVAAPPGRGTYCFRIHGTIYHRVGTLHPEAGEQRKYAQLYILDPDEAAEQRASLPENQGCSEELLRELSNFMYQHNQLAKDHQLLHEVEKESNAEAARNNTNTPNVTMAIVYDKKSDKRRYNPQRVSEVAVIFRNQDGEPPHNWDILVHLRRDVNNPNAPATRRVDIKHPMLDAMAYPVFFPYGDSDSGWHTDLKIDTSMRASTSGRRYDNLTQMMYFSYHFQIRNGFNQFLHGGKLTQQYFVDAYVRMEANRLKYIRDHQVDLKADSYQRLINHIADDNANPEHGPGKMVILPSSFAGSPRNMDQSYHDAMCIVQKFGEPDLFITMTCNPKWKEITDNLDGVAPEFRPDLVARVFRIKLNSLLEEITKKQIFGRVLAKIHVIEFQKRGLPHAHILLILDQNSKLDTANEIDSAIRAEIPDPVTEPRLYEAVTKHMLHGPCGSEHRNSPCMDKGKCTKGFPKDLLETTDPDRNGFPLYRRRKRDHVQVKGRSVDNSWVVPYNPYLLLRYDCHINVENCASIKSVKYLFKYVYKGHDCANLEVSVDEIKNYVDARYVSAPEAAWHIFGFEMHEQSHAIQRLAVHLPDEQTVNFRDSNIEQAVLNAENNDTTLTAWFKLNQSDAKARELFYFEIPEHYTFNKTVKPKRWQVRKRGHDNIIGRMYAVGVKDTERYFLRLLLLHVKGAKSFDDLRNVDNVAHTTFRDAAAALGLADNGQVWDDTLTEAALLQMPKQLRETFAFILIFCTPQNVIGLWESHKGALSEDYARHEGHNEECEDCGNMALRDIQNILRSHGRSLADFGFEEDILRNLPATVQELIDARAEKERGERMAATLNNEQRAAFDAVMNAVNGGNPRLFFLDGPGGSGKTYLYETLISTLRGNSQTPQACASTGIAANLLPEGRTYHSMFGFGIQVVPQSRFTGDSPQAYSLRGTDLIVWDEATMASSHALDGVNALMHLIGVDKQSPMAGKPFVLGGDFRQTLPIVPHGSRVAIVQSCLKYSTVWRDFQTFRLIHNNRSVDPAFSAWLLELGDGTLRNEDDLDEDIIEIPSKYICKGDLVDEIFGETLALEDVSNFANKFVLTPKNSDCDAINSKVLERLQGDTVTYLSHDEIQDGTNRDYFHYPIELINSYCFSGMPLHELKLKKGAIVILLRNMRKGLCNGTRLIIRDLQRNIIKAEILTGSAVGEIVFLPRIILDSGSELPVKIRRRQFPVKLAFAMTINKSQGQTADKVGIYLPKPVFSHGQLYVAFSRAKRSDDVVVQIVDTEEQGHLIPGSDKVFTRNVVFKEVFNDH